MLRHALLREKLGFGPHRMLDGAPQWIHSVTTLCGARRDKKHNRWADEKHQVGGKRLPRIML